MFAEDMGQRIAFPSRLLSEELGRASLDPFYESEGTEFWLRLKRIFQKMDQGGQLGPHEIHRFNGGLFQHDPVLDSLYLPNHLFFKAGQGRNRATIESEKQTLLYLASTYNFAADADSTNSIGLYTLGHIFEQSLVELEVLEAEAEERPSLSLITKRKRDGVYYTPEPIVRRIIDETLGPLLARWKEEAGWIDGQEPTNQALEIYWGRLKDIRTIDPACGSGAFLIALFRALFAEFRATMDARYSARLETNRIDDAEIAEMILSNNIYGVDINPLSVEIAQLSLWLHSARPRQPLSTFSHTVRCGNSLVSTQMYDRRPPDYLPCAARARVAPFNWEEAFPEIVQRGGFDIIVGNPPYVKLQHFRKVYEETANILRNGCADDASPIYRSTQTGNYDLYLPFIEKGLNLLHPQGRLGYIAPNLWPTLQYGAGLRKLIASGRHLERWIDFRSHQVFEEATIYTAIQVFTREPAPHVSVSWSRDGDLGRIDMAVPEARIPYEELGTGDEEWLFAPDDVRRLYQRLAAECSRLDDPDITSAIFQGVITSADHIYHLERVGTNRYLHHPPAVRGHRPPPVPVDLEDAIMKPLVSGAEAKRFRDPQTKTYLLFPYALHEQRPRLWSPEEMQDRFPRAWGYLENFRTELMARESSAFADEQWYRFGRNQNLDKQEAAKLLVAQTVPRMRVCFDHAGNNYANNVRVNGIIPIVDGWFLSAVLNSDVANAIFKWIAKPKDNNYFEANKQFIAPLPVPPASVEEQRLLGNVAQRLQQGYTRRETLLCGLSDRTGRLGQRNKPHEWLLPAVRPIAELDAVHRPRMVVEDRRALARRLYKEDVEAALAKVDDLIRLDSTMEAIFEDGELRFLVDDAVAAGGVYLDEPTGALVLAQWQNVALTFEPTGKGDAKRLVDRLRKVATDAPPELSRQIIERQQQLSELTTELKLLESQLHAMTCELYRLSPEERRLVES